MVCDTFLTTPVISLDSGNPSTPPIRMRSPLRMVANGVSDTIATLSVWLSLPLPVANVNDKPMRDLLDLQFFDSLLVHCLTLPAQHFACGHDARDEVIRHITHGGAAGAGTTAPLPLCRGPRWNWRGDHTVDLAWKTSNGGCHAELAGELDERKIL